MSILQSPNFKNNNYKIIFNFSIKFFSLQKNALIHLKYLILLPNPTIHKKINVRIISKKIINPKSFDNILFLIFISKM